MSKTSEIKQTSLPGLNSRETLNFFIEFLLFSLFYCSGLLITRGELPPSQYYFLAFSCLGATLGFHYLNKLWKNPKGLFDDVARYFSRIDIFSVRDLCLRISFLIVFLAILAFIISVTLFPTLEFSKVVDSKLLLISYIATALAIAWLDWRREWLKKRKRHDN